MVPVHLMQPVGLRALCMSVTRKRRLFVDSVIEQRSVNSFYISMPMKPELNTVKQMWGAVQPFAWAHMFVPRIV